MQGCFLKKKIVHTGYPPLTMDPCHVGTPCIDMIQLNTVESTVYERRDKLDDQKHVFYKFVHQTDRRMQIL